MNCKTIFYILIFNLLVACKAENREDLAKLNPVKKTLPDTVSFSRDIMPLFKNNCIESGCHTGTNPAGNLRLDEAFAYSNLTRKGSGYIDTIHPDFSVLYASLISVNNPMPPTGKLSDYEIELVHKWIVQKAKNN